MVQGDAARPRVAMDMYVLAQGVKTGVWRVCDELYRRLAASPRLDVRLCVRAGDEAKAAEYAREHGLRAATVASPPPGEPCILLSPFGVPPADWLVSPDVLHAHIVYDLIAVNRPDFFSQFAADEVRAIIDSIDPHTLVFAISESTRRELLEARPDLSPAQVQVIPLAAGPAFTPCGDLARQAAVRERYHLPPDAPFVLSLATLEIRKNLDTVVAAFLRYLEQEPASRMVLVLAGMSGWKLEQLEHALEKAGPHRDRIILTGFVAEADLSALYSAATCFIYLSRYEGFGLPPLEAMACGTPVICANNSSLPEVVGDAGMLIDADDVAAASRAISAVAHSPARHRMMAEAGLRRAAAFDWDRAAEIMIDTLVAAWAEHGQRPHNRRPRGDGYSVQLARYGLARGPIEANLLEYQNGSTGPVFARLDGASPARGEWPRWRDTLPGGASDRVEGGRRTRGVFKSGTPEAPLVTYVTVVRNNPHTLRRTLDSVQAQDWSNVEHILLDGASTDGTLDIVREYDDVLDYWASEPDGGLYDAINKIVPLARGQLICVLNSDDWLMPRAAGIAVHRMRGARGAALLLTAAQVQAGDFRHEWNPAFVHPGSWFLCANDCHNGIYATPAAYERSGPYDTGLRIVADFKWIMTCLEAGVRFVYTREGTVHYSLGGTSSDVRAHSLECMRVVAERFPFLTALEIDGLYHAFFQLAGPVQHEQDGRPRRLGDFVRAEFARRAGHADFERALTWAALAVLQHPQDVDGAAAAGGAHPLGVRRAAKALAKSVLHRNPRLYDIAASTWTRLRRG